MSYLFNFLVAISLAFSPLSAMAASENGGLVPRVQAAELTEEVRAASDLQVAFTNVTYSLENLDRMVQDLEVDAAHVAKGGISRNVALELKDKIGAGLTLLGLVINDPNLKFELQEDATVKLTSALGSLMFHIIRDRTADNRNSQDIAQNLSTLGKAKEFVKILFKDLFYDVKSLGLVRSKATPDHPSELLSAMLERGRREQLSVDLLRLYQGFAAHALPPPDDDKQVLSETVRTELHDYEAQMMLKIKRARIPAQFSATAIYTAVAFVGLVMPQFDWVGALELGRSENSLLVSSVGYFVLWGSIAVAKSLTISKDIVQVLEDLVEVLEHPESNLRPQRWSEKLKQKLWKLDASAPIKFISASHTSESCSIAYSRDASFSKPSWLKSNYVR